MIRRAREPTATSAAGFGRRLLIGLTALIVLAAGTYGSLWIWFGLTITAQAPDAFAPDGDPCCVVPDTWAQVLAGTAFVVVAAAVVAAVLAAGAALGVLAIAARWPHPRLLASASLVTALGVLGICVVAWATDDPGRA